MSISNVNEQGSEWMAAFSKRPIFFMSRKEMDACFDANGVLRKSRLKNVELREDTCTLSSNDTYRRSNTTYEVYDKDKGSAFLDLNFLIKDETSSLKGSLSDKNDVDFYNFTIPFLNFQRNYFGVEAYIDMPEGCDYDLTLYDEYGNQVGKAEWDGEGRKKLSVPNWDMDTNKYCLKVENGNGEEVSPNDFYRISFHVTDNKEHEKTDAAREAYGNLYSAYDRKDENWRDYLDEYNAVLRETEQNYIKELQELHRKQFESLPEEKKYKGDRTVDELLQDMAEGKELSEAEREYVKIFANLKDAEKAQQKAELKNDFTEDFVKDLEDRGVSREDIEGMRVRIRSNGDVTVDGIEDENIREQVQKLVREKYSDKMYRYYIGTADSVGNLPENAYQYATDVQEVKRYLKGVTGQDVSLKNLYMLPDGNIGGLPGKADKLINHTKDNVKVDQMRDALRNIIGNIGVSGDVGIPDFTSQFQFQQGAFSVVDSGFAVNMGALEGRLTPQYSGNMYSDMYRYRFKKVL
ncbi:MAG: hypothetical protein K2O59_03950 [Lachnospiraceae bacterium]|nr:hypothetical protein [Lachnospiraceae bacterium]